jgi:hypothetical protein
VLPRLRRSAPAVTERGCTTLHVTHWVDARRRFDDAPSQPVPTAALFAVPRQVP